MPIPAACRNALPNSVPSSTPAVITSSRRPAVITTQSSSTLSQPMSASLSSSSLISPMYGSSFARISSPPASAMSPRVFCICAICPVMLSAAIAAAPPYAAATFSWTAAHFSVLSRLASRMIPYRERDPVSPTNALPIRSDAARRSIFFAVARSCVRTIAFFNSSAFIPYARRFAMTESVSSSPYFVRSWRADAKSRRVWCASPV